MTTQTKTWTVDTAHSIAEFSAKHMLVSTVKGRFRDWQATIVFDEANPAGASADAIFQVASIDTGEEYRDNHLRSDDFFNAEQFPTMTFHSTRVEPVNANRFQVFGDLTIRDNTRPIALDVEYEGQIRDAFGKQRAAFTAIAKVNRKEFGLRWNGLIETGGAIVGDTITITLHLAATLND
ncbi:MAG: YceI family protein [Dehalococcoidia bacterium]